MAKGTENRLFGLLSQAFTLSKLLAYGIMKGIYLVNLCVD